MKVTYCINSDAPIVTPIQTFTTYFHVSRHKKLILHIFFKHLCSQRGPLNKPKCHYQ